MLEPNPEFEEEGRRLMELYASMDYPEDIDEFVNENASDEYKKHYRETAELIADCKKNGIRAV